MGLEHGKTRSFLDMTMFLQQSLAIFLQSPVHLSSGVPCFCFLHWYPHSHPNKDGGWRERFNFPTTESFSNFSVDNYAKIRAKRGLDQWEGSLPVLMEASKQAKGGRIRSGWLIVSAQHSRRTNLRLQTNHIIFCIISNRRG